MSALKIQNTAQKVMSAVFAITFSDTMYDINGVSYSLGADTSSDIIAAAKSFDVIKLPKNSVVVGGHVVVSTAFDTAGYDIKVGDDADDDRYLTSTDVKGLGTTALLTPGYVNVSGKSIRINVATDDACTTGVLRLTVDYVIDGRAEEVTGPAASQ